MRIIGMMSGTSLDGIDAAAADLVLEGDTLHLTPLGAVSSHYPGVTREALLAVLPPGATTMEAVCRLDTQIGQAFAQLAERANDELCDGQADAVVSHGQTTYHWVDGEQVNGTLQLGQPAWIAESTGLWVVSDLRSRDVAAGGQGAPLVSALDVLWLAGRSDCSVALNLGGIANVTVVSAASDPIAYDTGPANALIDAVVQKVSDGRADFDVDGAMGARGQVVPEILQALLADPYYRRSAPKSTGKELFNLAYLEQRLKPFATPSTDDLVATLTALTAATVADAVTLAGAVELVVAGGGTRNPTLMRMLRERMPDVTLRTSDELGLPASLKEAYAFAVLGFLTLSGLSSTVASCTGARHASVLGCITPGSRAQPRAEQHRAAPTRLRVHPPS